MTARRWLVFVAALVVVAWSAWQVCTGMFDGRITGHLLLMFAAGGAACAVIPAGPRGGAT